MRVYASIKCKSLRRKVKKNMGGHKHVTQYTDRSHSNIS